MRIGSKSMEAPSLEAQRASLAERPLNSIDSIPPCPLSCGQQRLWFLDQLEPQSALYVIPVLARLSGPLDASALQRAVNSIVARHEILRTRFDWCGEEPRQIIQERAGVRLCEVDLTGFPQEVREEEAARIARMESNRAFDLTTDPLLRLTLLRLEANEHLLVTVLHHIVADEWSLRVFFRELKTCYEAFVAGRTPELPELSIQYADYSLWQQDWLESETAQKQIRFWQNELAGAPPVLELRGDYPRQLETGFRGNQSVRQLNTEMRDKVRALGERQRATTFMVLLAAFQALLHRYTGQQDIIVASPIAGRNRLETEELVGFFVNTLLLRTNLGGDPSVADLLARVRKVTLGAYENQDLPFEKIVELMRPARSLNHLPFTRVMFVVQTDVLEGLQLGSAAVEFVPLANDTAKFDLTLVIQETSQGFVVRAEYNSRIFESASIERLLRHFEILLGGFVSDPARPVSELPLLTDEERAKMLVDWNDTASAYPQHQCIQQLFEAQATLTPEAPAAVFGAAVLTYGELNARANQLAHHLRKLGVGPDIPVAIVVEPSQDFVVGLLGILKAGGAYVCLDVRNPPERLGVMLNDIQSPVLLTQQKHFAHLPCHKGQVICLDADWELIAHESRTNPVNSASPENLAYVIFTSGSTGRPKGVAVPHRAVVRLVINTNYIRLDSSARVAQVSNVSFDAATFEIWGALLNGGRLVGIAPEVMLSPKRFAAELQEQGITAMFLTAAVFNQIAAEVPEAFQGLETLIIGGEALDPKWVRAVLDHKPPTRLLNGYGPTENTTFSCCFEIQTLCDRATNVPIGRPISNTQAFILDSNLKPVPIGVPGELYVAGDGLACGYWNRPELTRQKFVQSPFAVRGASVRLYKTGDLARFLPDGNLEFLGRIDQQVKLRGFRIELGEIETALGGHPEVRECAVTVHGNGADTRHLTAFVVPSGNSLPNSSEFRRFLGEKLPDYMIPATFVSIDSLPLNANGKLDRGALPAFDGSRPNLEPQYIPPRDELERKLVAIWEKVLGISPIGIRDRFFELGGHSLLAVKVVSQIEKALGKKVRLAALFQAPTVEHLGALLRDGGSIVKSATTSSLVEIQSRGTRPPLFLVHGAGGGMFWGYVNLSRHLGPDQPVYGFKSRGLEGLEEFTQISDMAAQYLADMRRVQPRGPYYLGGYCFGGIVAFEIARQLAAQAQDIGLLALFNCAPPNSRYTRIPWTPRWGLRLLRNLFYWAGYFHQWSGAQRREFFRWKWSLLQKRVRRLCSPTQGDWSRVDAGDLVDLSAYSGEQRTAWEAHIRALLDFHPEPFPGRVHLFRSPGHPLWCSFDPDYGWNDLAGGGVEITIVPGAHEKILEEPCVEVLAGKVSNHLRASFARVLNQDSSPQNDGAPQRATRAPNGKPHRHGASLPQWESVPTSETMADSNHILKASKASLPSCLCGPKRDFAITGTYLASFAAKAEQVSSGGAVRCAGKQLSYSELNTRANRLGHYLRNLGIGPEVLVGLCMERSLDLAVAVLAIWKAGGAFLPLDPDYPADRLAYMLTDSGARFVLTHERLRRLLPEATVQMVCLDDPELTPKLAACPSQDPATPANAENLAYVIYTSGSTGEPKGVEVPHRALLNHNLAVAQAYQLQPVDRVLQFTPLSFDISIEEIFPTWLSGATVVLRTDEAIFSPARFLQYIEREGITVLNLPTAYWREVVDYLQAGEAKLPSAIRLLIIGGEAASEADFRKWKEAGQGKVTLINAYGATEATITSTTYEASGQEDSLPIGRPLPNVQALILDEHQRPVATGAEGELYLGGDSLARGYLHRPELTAERFIPNPFPAEIDSSRLYRTGDLARLNPSGEIEFRGRLDEQVKVRGYRIELGEIEAVLETHPAVRDAVVMLREDTPGNKRLAAYVIPREGTGCDFQTLQSYLKRKLPAYMVPASFIPLQALPLTPAGKVDRRALPAPPSARPELTREFVAPQTPLEQVLANIWSELLGINPLGIHDNLFDLGAHSLLAIQAASRIRQFLHVEVALEQLLAKPTIAELAADLAKAGTSLPAVLPASAVPTGARSLPLSARQKRIWLLEQFQQPYSPYNRTMGVRLHGVLDTAVLRQCMRELGRRHEGLRAMFPVWTGAPIQYICSAEEIRLPVFDLMSVPESKRTETALRRIEEEARRSYVLVWPVFRPALIKLSEQEHWLLFLLHEIVADARSLRQLYNELCCLYEAALTKRQIDLPEPETSYADIVSETGRGVAEQQDWAYWKDQLEGAPAFLDLPADRPRPLQLGSDGARLPVSIPGSIARGIEELSQREGTSAFATLFSAFATLLHRYTGETDIVIGSLAPPETGPRFQNVIANRDNPVALRCDLAGDPTFAELVCRVDKTIKDALAHTQLGFEELVDRLRPERDVSYSRVFQTAFLLEDPLPAQKKVGQLSFVPFEVDNHTSKMSLVFFLTRMDSGYSGWCEYSTALFDQDRMLRLVQHYETILRGALETPQQPVSQLPLLPASELELIHCWNETQAPYPRNQTLADLFLEQAERTPNAEALVCGSLRLTYRELCERAKLLAKHLRNLGVARGDLVGICLGRSPDMVASMLATLMVGGAYVPLDPAYPAERLGFILQDSQVKVLMTQGSLMRRLPVVTAKVLEVDQCSGAAASTECDQSMVRAETSDLAYVIYTSGSTGRPKGVAIEHRSAVALIAWAQSVYSAEELSGVLASTSICFDLSIFELFVPLTLGGKVILAENALALANLPAGQEVKLVNTVPSAIRELLRLDAVPGSVQVINLAGEPLTAALVDEIYRKTSVKKVYDLYGPTETTTYSTCALRLPGKPATIGRPLANEEILILDRHLQLMPLGIPGELYIGGEGLARGYLNRPELTAERFVPHPFQSGKRLYRTGDIARWGADGNLEYLGRLDHQVKIRGFRIELGEIEAVLRRHPAVREVVVLAREDNPGDRRLVAYVVAAGAQHPSSDELRQMARGCLPEHMVPAVCVWLDTLPLTPNGKLDRNALPVPGFRQPDSKQLLSPCSSLEEQVLAIWSEVLGHNSISVDDNFFEIGGHSLLATQVISRLRERFDAQVPILAFFAAPRIRDLADGLASSRWNQDSKALGPSAVKRGASPAPVSFVQERLWFLAQLDPGTAAYNVPAALRLQGPLARGALQGAFEALVARHEVLRTSFAYENGLLTQKIISAPVFEIVTKDFGVMPAENRETAALEWLKAQASQPFDLGCAPLFRARLARLNDSLHLLVVVFHHTICDGWSLANFFQELQLCYDALAAGQPLPGLPVLSLQYADFADWQRRSLQGPALERELAYWKDTLRGAPSKIELPADFSVTAQTEAKAARCHTLLEGTLGTALAELGKSESCTPFMILMAALAITLHKWSQQNDLVLGTVVAGRTRREFEQVLGCFMNFLPLRARVLPGDTGRSVLARMKATVLEGQSHQECPFEKIVETVNPERELNRNPLYNVALLLQNFPPELFCSRTLRATRIPVPLDSPLLDLRFEVEPCGEGLSVECEYRTDEFAENTIQELLVSYVQALELLARRPAARLEEFRLSRPLEEQARKKQTNEPSQKITVAATFTAELLAEPLQFWMDKLDIPASVQFAPYNQVFQELLSPDSLCAANKAGLNVMLVRLEDWCPEGKEGPHPGDDQWREHLVRTGQEFLRAIKVMAARVTTPSLVCFCPSSKRMLSDPLCARHLSQVEAGLLRELAELTGVFALSSSELTRYYPVGDYDDPVSDELGHIPYTPAFFTALATAIARKFHALRRPPLKAIVLDCDNTLWSGVCGEEGPHGLRLEPGRRALQQFMRAQLQAGRVLCLCSKNNEEDVLAVFSQRADMPLRLEHFAARRLNWLSKSENIKSLAAELNLGLEGFVLLDDNPVECAEVQANCAEVVTLQLPLEAEHLPHFLDHCWIFDQLKTTREDRRRSEMYRENRQREQLRAQTPSLAEFIQNLELNVCIEPLALEHVPRASQLTLRTNQFNCTSLRLSDSEVQARLAQSEVLTVTVSDRFGDYGLTGLVICRLEKPVLEVEVFLLSCRVLGRGIEHRILAYLGRLARSRGADWVGVHFVRSAKNKPALDFLEAVGAPFRQALNGGYVFRFPAAFAEEVVFNPVDHALQPVSGPAAGTSDASAYAAKSFKEFCKLALELDDASKIHRAVQGRTAPRSSGTSQYRAPQSGLERQLCDLWRELLRVERVGISDNFFELGGHSLLAVRLFAEIEKLVGRKIPLVTIFQAPTIEQLARALTEHQAAAPGSLLVPIQTRGSRQPLFLIHGAGGDVLWGYANLAAHMPSDQPIYGIKSRGQAGLAEPGSLREMAAIYLDAVRSFQPCGPYFLGGYCFGGNVAYEMARQLKAAGEKVGFVALLDSAPSNVGYETVTWWRPEFAWRFARNFRHWWGDFRALPTDERRRFIARKTRWLGRKLKRRLSGGGGQPQVDIEEVIDPTHFPEHELKLWQVHLQLLINHFDQPYDGRVVLLRTAGQPLFCSFAEDFCWGNLTRVVTRQIPGSHESIFMEPNVQFLARELTAVLEESHPKQPQTT